MKNFFTETEDLHYSICIKDVDNQELLVNDLSEFTIQAYTRDESVFVVLTKDMVKDSVLYIPQNTLNSLSTGPLKFKFFIGLANENYPDGVYNITKIANTGYFLKHNPKTENE
jgi:hypothetical protein